MDPEPSTQETLTQALCARPFRADLPAPPLALPKQGAVAATKGLMRYYTINVSNPENITDPFSLTAEAQIPNPDNLPPSPDKGASAVDLVNLHTLKWLLSETKS